MSTEASYARFFVDDRIDLTGLIGAVERLGEEIEVVSMGQSSRSSSRWARRQSGTDLRGFAASGTHGLGHTRLSTESKVDLSHSQPFGSHGHPDLAIVHNGHITNYHQLRRRYEQREVRFYTENDSEVVAIYLADQLHQGRAQKRSQAMLRDLDGSFSCLVATATQIGFVKDPFALKPLLWAETEVCGPRQRGDRDSLRAARRLRGSRGAGERGAGMGEVNCEGRSTREINAEIKQLIERGRHRYRGPNPGARHNLGVAILEPVTLRLRGQRRLLLRGTDRRPQLRG